MTIKLAKSTNKNNNKISVSRLRLNRIKTPIGGHIGEVIVDSYVHPNVAQSG